MQIKAYGTPSEDPISRRLYREYVLQGLEGEIENPFDEVVHQSLLGTQSLVERVKDKLRRLNKQFQ
jgi:hypothetical protein